MKTTNRYLLFLMASFCLLFGACSDNNDPLKPGPDPNPGQETSDEIYYANHFAYDVLSDIYLWKNEIADGLKQLVPGTSEDPIKTVSEITYREGDKLVDKWTALTDNLEEMQGSVDGVATTFGYGLQFGKFSNSDSYFAIVTYVVKDSPAEAAGLKRGDIILQINNADITDANYTDLYYAAQLSLTTGKLNEENTVIPSGQVSMTAAKMYEDPVLLRKVFDLGAKKVGYIVYNGFDLPSAKTWLEACKEFKQQGIYNGKWFTPLREALQAFAVKTQEYVTGTVKLKLYKGNIITSSVTSPCSLYSENLVTFEESDYNQDDATGFINLWGLPDTVQALREQGKLQ